MAFETAGQDNNKEKYSGIPFSWDNLEHKCCPRCGDELVAFDHLKLWKCFCGFNISYHKRDEIVANMLGQGDVYGFSNGYGFGNYQDHPPF